MVIHGGRSFLGFWKPGDANWTNIESYDGAFCDVSYHNEKFYAINTQGQVWVWDDKRPASQLRVAHFLFSVDEQLVSCRIPYLVERVDGLLLVTRRVNRGYGNYKTKNFKMCQLDIAKLSSKRITSLGGDAIFVGDSAAISVPATELERSGIMGNRIYFTDDSWEEFFDGGRTGRGGGEDMGIYNVEDRTIESFRGCDESLSILCPPVWIVPSF
ncbi:OLC1v1019009C1 [Oldenlandia corymbosa var. corymbosa]|uniref:OLC1v1019009C1 n=1 Tax=Oldenlandia corymbosa var. corymbosa TaxID=529605 RepID=A0AAV1ED32_OLDCO|nr:OLC1v1019009C1 [Oldenlandia corymbosa var. corymbosa]